MNRYTEAEVPTTKQGKTIENAVLIAEIKEDPETKQPGPSTKHMYSETERAMDWSLFQFYVKGIQGKTLTIVDAMSLPEKQSRAVKGLIKQAFSERLQRAKNFFFDGVCERSTWPSEEDDRVYNAEDSE